MSGRTAFYTAEERLRHHSQVPPHFVQVKLLAGARSAFGMAGLIHSAGLRPRVETDKQ